MAKRSARVLLILFTGLIIVTGCREEAKKIVKTTPVTFTKEGTLKVYRGETDSLLIQLDIEIAEGEYETQTGLMYREGMEQTQGMLFVFPEEAYHSFYMKNTRFPLDIIYIDSEQKVSSIIRNARPMLEKSLPSNEPVMYVLEVNAGTCDQWNIREGDRIAFYRL